MSISIFNCSQDNVDNFKYLGFRLTTDFTCSNHVEYVLSKVNQRLGLLRKIKHVLPLQAPFLFHNSVFLPIFDYADLVWGDKKITLP